MILITTAGKVGSEAARLLTQRDESVRVLVRDPEKASALSQLGVPVAEGDLDDSASIDAAMDGVTSVVLVSPAVPAQQDAQTMVDAGVPAVIAEMNAHAVSLIAEGDAAWLSQDVPTVLGRPGRSFEQFATDHAQAFTQGG